MKLFKCQHCGQLLFFENRVCEKCGHTLGYIPDRNVLATLEAEGDVWRAPAYPQLTYRFCSNADQDVCNWLVPPDNPESLCLACRHNQTIPDISVPANLVAWRKLEFAKHRLFYTLLRLKLPIENRADNPNDGLVFDFLADSPAPTGPKVMTGHDEGLITIALAEADDAERERRRTSMREPYRTLLGHFRHEVGHYYWDRLVRDENRLEECRAVFGDDSEDYAAALEKHYKEGVPANWQENFISAYATTHAWEDFAETWAHYLHIVDALEMARSFGLKVSPGLDKEGVLEAEVDFNPYAAGDVKTLIDAWIPLTFAMNSINRGMGLADLYPFILSPAVVTKLGYVHQLVHAERRS